MSQALCSVFYVLSQFLLTAALLGKHHHFLDFKRKALRLCLMCPKAHNLEMRGIGI